MLNFNGIRHYLEFLPAAALICGFGVSRPVKSLSGNSNEKKLLLACTAVVVLALNIYWIGIRYYPYQYIYYNSLVKGLSGAEKVFGIDEATDYWSVSYRQGMNWLNNNTTGDISLYVPYCDWLVRLPRHIWLRRH